jgi:tRNA nucleotidyltransferase (CCA-adding enzyme)
MIEAPGEAFVKELAKRVKGDITAHARFMTFTIYVPDAKLDIVTAREERYSAPGALPEVTASTIEKDMRRRDFTVNAIAAYLNSFRDGEIVDPFFGRADLKAKLIRFLHVGSFHDDPTRIYRAARFAARFGFDIEKRTMEYLEEAVRNAAPAILSPVRRRHEFELILKEENPITALDLLEKWNALKFVHEDWIVRPEHRESLAKAGVGLPYLERLPARLAAWFKPWGAEAAKKMMGDLSFERAMKKEVLNLASR